MAKKKGTTKKLAKQVKRIVNFVYPIIKYGTVPAVILIGMRTEPRPRLIDVLSPN
ncbi:unnamed protein product [Heterosigma akashiwo]